VPLEFRCFDRTGTVLEAGKKLFAALCAEESGGVPWAVKTIRGEILRRGALSPMVRGKPAALTAAVNVYNEIFWDLSPMDTQGLARLAAGSGRLLSSLSDENGMILALEPGIPRSGEFITLLREALAAEGRRPLSPCPHQGPCPFPGPRQAKWCHFAFDTQDAPEALRRLSAAAGLPKDRAVTSFLLAGKPREAAAAAETAKTAIRIISDPFPTGGGFWGRYGCGAGGMVLVRGTKTAADEEVSGTLGFYESAGKRDGKTGADVFNLTANTTGKGKSEE
ncbi:MAG: rRNA methyltransferase, partial [Treponema sp.]|nr:rRNA methyltransferase [Treponema sp.]